MRLRIIRITTQIIFLVLFFYLMFKMVNPVESPVPVNLYTRIDSLLGLAAIIAGRAFYSGWLLIIPLLVITLVVGRVFCGWICPMGTTLDLSDKIFFRKRKRKRSFQMRQTKYYILIGLLITALFTMQAVYLLDPLSILTRSSIVCFFAPLQMSLKWVLDQSYVLAGNPHPMFQSVGIWVSDHLGQWAFVTSPQIYMRQSLVFGAFFIVIIALNSISSRFWCRNLCPLGALLGLIGRVPIVRRIVGEGCNDCGRCIGNCKMNAISDNPLRTRLSECILCLDCVDDCPKKAIRFGFGLPSHRTSDMGLDLSRRRLLQAMGIGLAFSVMAKIDPSRKRAAQAANTKISSGELIRPPGSVIESEFVNRCIRCGNCMKTCPTGGLQPAITEAGIEGFWTPVLVPRIGCCQQHCNSCGEVCPTKAVEPFKIEEKDHLYLGTSNVDRNRCIAWALDQRCVVCSEYCSYSAIEPDMNGDIARPVVNPLKCVGCGQCENACPVQPVAAIRVYSIGDKRYLSREEQLKIRRTADANRGIDGAESGGKYPGMPY